MSDFTLAYLNPEQWGTWDAFVDTSPQGTIFQKSAYIQCVTGGFNRPAKIIAVFRRDKIAGGAVIYPRNRLGFQYISSLYFVPYNGFLFDDFSESTFYYRRNQLQNRVLKLLVNELKENYVFCEFHHSPALEDVRQLIWNGWQFIPEYTAVINLQTTGDLLDSMDRDQRRRIRHFESSSFQWVTPNEPALLYDLMEKSYTYHKLSPPIPREPFLKFTRYLLDAGIARIYGIEQEGRLITALLIVEDAPVLYALFSGRLVEATATGAELYLFWRVAREYREKNYRQFDLLGAMMPSIAKVKLELGARLRRSDRTRYFRNAFIRALFHLKTNRERKQRQM